MFSSKLMNSSLSRVAAVRSRHIGLKAAKQMFSNMIIVRAFKEFMLKRSCDQLALLAQG